MASGKWQMVNSRCVEWMDIVFPVVCSLTPLFEILINYQNQNQNQTPHLEQHIDIPTAVASPRLKNHSKHLGQIKMRIYSRHSTQLSGLNEDIRYAHITSQDSRELVPNASSRHMVTTHQISNIKYHAPISTTPHPRFHAPQKESGEFFLSPILCMNFAPRYKSLYGKNRIRIIEDH